MRIVAQYSFNNGEDAVTSRYGDLLDEIHEIIASIAAKDFKTKRSAEKTMNGQLLFSPRALNREFKREFEERDWKCQRVLCNYPENYYIEDYRPIRQGRGAFREMDFLKRCLGVELQLGKYAFMVYNVCAKMTIFRNLGYIDTGIEIVPVKELAEEMLRGVSYFEQFIWDLEARGVSDIDIPVLILGIAP